MSRRSRENLNLFVIQKKAVAGVLALTGRTACLQMINFLSTFLLTIFLSPQVFGVFFVVSAVISFLSYFSDIGLAAALVQKKEEIKKEDLKTTFTVQQSLVIFLVLLALSASSLIARFYHLNSQGIWLFRAFVFSFFLSSLKTIPSVLLERKLEFQKLVLPQLGETLVFNITAVFLAYKGLGVLSFAWAVVLRGIVGLLLIYWLAPFRPTLGIVWSSAEKLLAFGIPYQLNSFLALLKDNLLVAFLGRVLPLAEVGFLGWAQKWAFFPLRFFMDSVIKVAFPTFSRLQDNLPALKKAIEKSLFWVCFLTYPLLIGLGVLAPKLVLLIPRYNKWQSAIFPLFFFILNALFSCFSTTLTNVLNALGRIKTTLKLMVFWTVLTWILTVVLVIKMGFLGVALASALVASTSLLTLLLVERIIPFSLKVIFVPLLSALIMGGGVCFLLERLVSGFFSLGGVVIIGGIIYLSLVFLFDRRRLLRELCLVKKVLL